MSNALNANLPLHLQYHRHEEVIKAEAAFQQTLAAAVRKLQTVNHIQPKVLAEEYLLPLIGYQTQFFSLQVGDLMRYIVQVSLAGGMPEEGDDDDEDDVVVGIAPDDAEAILAALRTIGLFLQRVQAAGGKSDIAALRKEAGTVLADLKALTAVIEDLTLEESDEDVSDDEGDFIDFEDDEDDELEDEVALPIDEDEPEQEQEVIDA